MLRTPKVLIEDLRLTDSDFLKRMAILLFHPDPEKYVTGAFIKIVFFFFESVSELHYQDEVYRRIIVQTNKAMN